MRSDPAIVPLFGMGVCKFVATDWCGLVCRRGNYPSQLAGEGGFLLCATVTACECRIPLGRICRRCKPVKAQPLSLSLLPSAVRNCTRESKAHQFTCVSSFSFLRLFFSPPPHSFGVVCFPLFFFLVLNFFSGETDAAQTLKSQIYRLGFDAGMHNALVR